MSASAIYEIIVLPAIGKVAQGNLPDRALSLFQVYCMVAKSGQIVELRRNGLPVRQSEAKP